MILWNVIRIHFFLMKHDTRHQLVDHFNVDSFMQIAQLIHSRELSVFNSNEY
jgi:hypothetical protein